MQVLNVLGHHICDPLGVTLFRCIAVVTRNIVVANGLGMLMLLCTILLDGFVIPKRYIHPWVVW